MRLPANVILIDSSTIRLQCTVCKQVWSPNLLPGGRLPHNSKQCPNGPHRLEQEDEEGLDPALEEALNDLDDEMGTWRIGNLRERTDLILPTTWQEAARRQSEGLTRTQGRKTKRQQ